MNGIIGKKLGMTQMFTDDGVLIPVTAIEAGPCTVVELKTTERNGYKAVTLGFGEAKRVTKPFEGIFKKAKITPKKLLKEFRITEGDMPKMGSTVDIGIFTLGELIDVRGTTKGKGFQGVMKRWNFAGGDASHGGRSDRIPGSIGASSDPSRVFKGKHMPGLMGNKPHTVTNLKVVGIDSERSVLLVKGSVPGANNEYVIIKKKASHGGRK